VKIGISGGFGWQCQPARGRRGRVESSGAKVTFHLAKRATQSFGVQKKLGAGLNGNRSGLGKKRLAPEGGVAQRSAHGGETKNPKLKDGFSATSLPYVRSQ